LQGGISSPPAILETGAGKTQIKISFIFSTNISGYGRNFSSMIRIKEMK
jgi:hypothetical protein